MKSNSVEIAIVGGGLVGSLLALNLRKLSDRVHVFERRPDLRRAKVSAGRSINLIATRRGLHALGKADELGLLPSGEGLAERVLDCVSPVSGRSIHGEDGQVRFQPYGMKEVEKNFSVSRGELNQILLCAAEDAGVTFHFEHQLVDSDLDRGELTFEVGKNRDRTSVQCNRIFGADGASSKVRAEFEKIPEFETRYDDLGHAYKELLLPADENGAYRLDEKALHIWPRGRAMLMALPNRDGTFTLTLYLPQTGSSSFEELDSPSAVAEFFKTQFPDAAPLLPDLEREFFQNPTGSLGTRRCNFFHRGGRALLIGDSAHAIVPFFGQGMNSGFEDVTELMGSLQDHGDWDRAFAEFSFSRKPNVDAIAEMSLENFHEMSEHVGDSRFLLRKQVEQRLEKELLHEYRTRYSMVVYSRIPYSFALAAGRIQEGILDRLCDTIDRPEEVDLQQARDLIREELRPFLESKAIDLAF